MHFVVLWYFFQLYSKTDDIERLLMTTLFYVQASKEDDFALKARLKAEVDRLICAGLIESKEKIEDGISVQHLEVTRLGLAAYKG